MPVCSTTEIITTPTSPRKKCPKYNENLKIIKTQETAEEPIELTEEVKTDIKAISIETEEGRHLERALGGIVGTLDTKQN